MHIEISTDTIEKLLKPIEGKHLDEDEMQEALKDTLTNLLPTDTKVNEEAAKTLLLVSPDIKEAALNNPRLDTQWLGTSLETNLKEQGNMMEKIASSMRRLISLLAVVVREERPSLVGCMRLSFSLLNPSRVQVEASVAPESLRYLAYTSS